MRLSSFLLARHVVSPPRFRDGILINVRLRAEEIFLLVFSVHLGEDDGALPRRRDDSAVT